MKDFEIVLNPWHIVGDDPPADPPVDPPADPPADPPVGFTQAQLDEAVEKATGKYKADTRKQMDEIAALKKKGTLSTQEREDLDRKIEELSTSVLSTEEKASRDKKKTETQHQKEISDSKGKYDKLWKKYNKETVGRGLLDAAIFEEAISPPQVVAILEPMSELVPILDDENKATGDFDLVINFPDVDKDDKPVKMKFTPKEAAKRMKELPQHFNLFKGEGKGGMGGTGRTGSSGGGKTGKNEAHDLAKNNPRKYQEMRRKGEIKLEDL